jgi:hypothetical protein
MSEGEVAGRTPRTPVVEVENIPSGTANILGQIKIALVPREPVQQHHRRMRPRACGDINKRVEKRPVAGNLKTFHGSGIGSLLSTEREQYPEPK